MKTTIKLIAIFIVSNILFASCEKDEESFTSKESLVSDISQSQNNQESEIGSKGETSITSNDNEFYVLRSCLGTNDCFGAKCVAGFVEECPKEYICTCLKTQINPDDQDWTDFDYELTTVLGYDSPSEVYDNWDNFEDMIAGNDAAIQFILEKLEEENS